MTATGSGTSHGKIILIGEHSVVYGQPAIALPLPKVSVQVTCQLNDQGNQHEIKSPYYSGKLVSAPNEFQGLYALVTSTLSALNYDDPLLLTINSALPPERGMGSSAAISGAMIRAIFDLYHQPLLQETLLALIDVEEQISHGNPSGLDAITTISNTPIWFIKNQTATKIDLHLSGYLVIMDSGILGSTGQVVADVRETMKKNRQQTMARMLALGELTHTVRKQLSNNQLLELGAALNQAQIILSQLGISNARLDHFIKQANELGSLGTKLSGGGRGGCLIALMPDENSANQLGMTMKKNGIANYWLQPLGENFNK